MTKLPFTFYFLRTAMQINETRFFNLVCSMDEITDFIEVFNFVLQLEQFVEKSTVEPELKERLQTILEDLEDTLHGYKPL